MSDEQQERVTCGSLAGTVDPATGDECDGVAVASTTMSDRDLCWVMAFGGLPLAYADTSKHAYCPKCGALLSFDDEGNPVAEAMVPKSKLEWLAGEAPYRKCPVQRRAGVWDDLCPDGVKRDHDYMCRKRVLRQCWVDAALAAVEEAPDGSEI